MQNRVAFKQWKESKDIKMMYRQKKIDKIQMKWEDELEKLEEKRD